MTETSEKPCEQCAFFYRAPRMRPDHGECRRRAPVAVPHFKLTAAMEYAGAEDNRTELMYREVYWSVVSIDDWCGEWQQRPLPVPKPP